MRVSSLRSFLPIVLLSATTCSYLRAQSSETCEVGSSGAMVYAGHGRNGNLPFTATVTETHDQQFVDGNSIHTSVTTHQWRDSSGRMRMEMQGGCVPGDDGEMHARMHVTVFDPVSGKTYSWISGPDIRKIATVSSPVHAPAPSMPHLTPEEQQKRQAALRKRMTEERSQNEPLGSKVILGVQTEGNKTTHTLPIGRIGNALPLTSTEEMWIAKDLGLTMLRLREDPQSGKWRTEVVELTHGEPDPALFLPPADYEIEERVTKFVSAAASTPSTAPTP